jgi:hypothetical protein
MALSDIALCSRALVRLGARPIASFTDPLAEAEVANFLYAPARDALLSSYHWSFATAQSNLTKNLTAPVADFAYAYNLPTQFLRALSAGDGGRGRGLRFRIRGTFLETDAEAVTLTYIFRPVEADCPAYFDSLLIARLAADFCIPLTENTSRAEALIKIAQDEFMRTRQIDAQQDTPQKIEDFSLINARD